MKNRLSLLFALVLIGCLLAVPRPVQALTVQTHYNVTLTNGSVIYCPRVVYEWTGRLECIFASGAVVHYEKADVKTVTFVVDDWSWVRP